MLEQRLADVIRTIDALAQVEQTVGEFYHRCSAVFLHDSDFWLRLSNDEFLHAAVLTKLSQMIVRKPHEFEPGQMFPPAAKRTFIARILSDSEKLMAGTLTMYDALLVAYHIEATMIESNYTEVVETKNPEYIKALDNLAVATVQHSHRIKKKMNQYKKNGTGTRKSTARPQNDLHSEG
jgi:hypothetical protein